MSFTAHDHAYMARALELAVRGLYTTDPNPRVGCVLVRDGRVLGEGWHRRAGEPHAEVHALQAAAEARGATAYVTLEPCSHHGRTPPCAEALVAAGVARVVVAMEDPNPRVAGAGLRRLQQAGIETASGLLSDQAEALNPGFTKRMRQGLPYLRVKLASSLDGRTAMRSGESKWITSDAARRDVHRLRARSSAIVTGIGTVLADDPRLTVRDVAAGEGLLAPLRVVLDRSLRTPPGAQVLAGGALLFHGAADPGRAEALRQSGAELQAVPEAEPGLDLLEVLRELGAREINEVLIEAGPTLAGACLQQGLADELVLYLAPHLMGHEGRPLLSLPGLERMDQRLPLERADVRQVGEDLRIVMRPRGRPFHV